MPQVQRAKERATCKAEAKYQADMAKFEEKAKAARERTIARAVFKASEFAVGRDGVPDEAKNKEDEAEAKKPDPKVPDIKIKRVLFSKSS